MDQQNVAPARVENKVMARKLVISMYTQTLNSLQNTYIQAVTANNLDSADIATEAIRIVEASLKELGDKLPNKTW